MRRCSRARRGRPVKLIYDRVEDMVATTKRHPVDRPASHRPDARRPARGDGHRSRCSTPAPTARSARWCCRAALIHASGPYRCPNVRIRGRAMRTNTPPNGAFRGFGAPQTQFAVEVHMDRIAADARHRSGHAARDERAAARRHDGDRPDPCPTTRARSPCCRRRCKRTRLRAQAQASGRAPIAASACRSSSTARASPASAR